MGFLTEKILNANDLYLENHAGKISVIQAFS
ncbi:hypothetical protein Misp06_02278 [Microbulbifer sp. NBRC 101763]